MLLHLGLVLLLLVHLSYGILFMNYQNEFIWHRNEYFFTFKIYSEMDSFAQELI